MKTKTELLQELATMQEVASLRRLDALSKFEVDVRYDERERLAKIVKDVLPASEEYWREEIIKRLRIDGG